MTLDPKALEAAARELCAAEGHKDPDTMIFAAFAHDKPPRPRWTFYEDDASTAITAYLAATKATAPDPAPVSGWRDIATAPSAKPVLVAYKNRCDKWRVVKAVKYEQYQNEQPADDDEGEVGEYCEEKDAYFVRAGWYELIDNWDDFGFVAIYEGDPVAWMNLPDHLKQQEPK